MRNREEIIYEVKESESMGKREIIQLVEALVDIRDVLLDIEESIRTLDKNLKN